MTTHLGPGQDDSPTADLDLSASLRHQPATGRGRAGRRRWRVAVAVAVTLVVLAAGAVGVLWATREPAVSAATISPSAGPAPSPAAAPTEAGPAVSDSAGAALPTAAAAGARRVYAALQNDDTAGLAALYRPRAAGVAPWSTVRSRLAPPTVRAGLLSALRNPPSRPGDVAYLYSSGVYGVGLGADGTVAFFGTGQGQNPTAPAGTTLASSAGSTGAEPVLGDPSWAPGVRGFGVARPQEINANGDGTSYVDDVTWSSWGGQEAVGAGTAYWVPPDAPDMTHGQEIPARVVASDLGPCHGHLGYREINWYFPQKGETPADAGGYDTICEPW